ncbi:MAG: hypothetical protein E7358_06960, partial [Clostridiales bacterium]|nr:hypothetical protein [Clostridiales bacterium]
AAYSLVTYQTAYLKCYYKPEFLTAVLNNRITNIEEITNYVSYAKEERVPVLPPDINESKTYFSVKNDVIRFGLAAVKGVGVSVIDEIIKERETNGKFTSFEDFAMRCIHHVNKRLVENLIYAGAFDCFGVYRSRLIGVYEDVLDKAQAIIKERESDQISFFELLGEPEKIEVIYPNVSEYDQKAKLVYEKNVLGVYVSGHPLEDYKDKLKKYSFSTALLLSKEEDEDGEVVYTDVNDGDLITMCGIITGIKKVATKSGQFMSVLTIEDLYGPIECVMFPKVHEKYRNKIEQDNIVELKGKLQIREGREPSVMIEHIEPLGENAEQTVISEPTVKEKKRCLGIKIPENIDVNSVLNELYEILSAYPGDITVFIKNNGKAFKCDMAVRECRGLITELTSIVDEKDILFFEK